MSGQHAAGEQRHATDEVPMRSNRPFTRYLSGFGLSLLADQVWFVALGWAASRLQTPAQTSLVMAAATLPRAVLLLFGGAWADRWGVLRTVLASQGLRTAVMALGTIALLSFGEEQIILLLTLSMVFGALDAAHMPAAAALPPYLLPKTQLPAGQGVVQALERTASIAGAPLAGLLVAAGLAAATALNTLALLIALLLMLTLRAGVPSSALSNPAASEAEGAWKSLTGGLRYLATHPVLGRVLLTVTVLNLALAGPLNVGIALLASARGWDASAFSLILTGFASGAVTGAVATAARRRRPRAPAAAGLRWVFAGSFAIAILPASSQLLWTVVTAGVLGITTGPAGAYLLGTVQAQTDKEYLGRVMSLVTFSALGLTPVSVALFGVISTALSVSGAFGVCAGALAISAVIAYANGPLRRSTLTNEQARS